MPLRRLTSLEKQNLQQEFEQLTEQMNLWRILLSDQKDLQSLKRKYNDPRQTKLVTLSVEEIKKPGDNQTKKSSNREGENLKVSAKNLKLEVPSEEAILEFTHRERIAPKSKKSKTENNLNDHDFITQTEIR